MYRASVNENTEKSLGNRAYYPVVQTGCFELRGDLRLANERTPISA